MFPPFFRICPAAVILPKEGALGTKRHAPEFSRRRAVIEPIYFFLADGADVRTAGMGAVAERDQSGVANRSAEAAASCWHLLSEGAVSEARTPRVQVPSGRGASERSTPLWPARNARSASSKACRRVASRARGSVRDQAYALQYGEGLSGEPARRSSVSVTAAKGSTGVPGYKRSHCPSRRSCLERGSSLLAAECRFSRIRHARMGSGRRAEGPGPPRIRRCRRNYAEAHDRCRLGARSSSGR